MTAVSRPLSSFSTVTQCSKYAAIQTIFPGPDGPRQGPEVVPLCVLDAARLLCNDTNLPPSCACLEQKYILKIAVTKIFSQIRCGSELCACHGGCCRTFVLAFFFCPVSFRMLIDRDRGRDRDHATRTVTVTVNEVKKRYNFPTLLLFNQDSSIMPIRFWFWFSLPFVFPIDISKST
jgi:hypothetical protein